MYKYIILTLMERIIEIERAIYRKARANVGARGMESNNL